MFNVRIDATTERLNQTYHSTHTSIRSFRDDERKEIKRLYSKLDEAHHNKEWGYFLAFFGAFCKVCAAPLESDTTLCKSLLAASSLFEGASAFKIKLDEGTIAHLQGLLEQTRTRMQGLEHDDEELNQKLRHIEQMLSEAKSGTFD